MILQLRALSRQEALVVVQDVDLTTQRLRSTLDLYLRIVQLVVLSLDDAILLLDVLLLHLKLTELVVTVLTLDALDVGCLDLVVELSVVALELSIATLKFINAAMSIESDIFELLLQLFFLHALPIRSGPGAN